MGNFFRKTAWPSWKSQDKSIVRTPVIYLSPEALKIDEYPAQKAIGRFEFFRKNLIPKLSIFDQFPIEKQIFVDRNSTRKNFWPQHIAQLNNERLK